MTPLPRWPNAPIPGLSTFIDKFSGSLERILSNGAENGVTAAPVGPAGGSLRGNYPKPGQSLMISSYFRGVLPNSARLDRRTFSIPVSLLSTWIANANSDVAATASTVFTVKSATAAAPNTFTNIGTITFGAGATTGAFSGTTAHSFAVGDILVIDGPAVADATLAGVSVTIVVLG